MDSNTEKIKLSCKRNLEAIKIYSESEDGVRIINCGKDVLTGQYYRISVDYITDPYDQDNLRNQETYFLIGMMGALESELAFNSLEDLLRSYEEDELPNRSSLD